MKEEHTAAAEQHKVWGVPTFVQDGQSVFVRLMNRPEGDGALATTTVERVLDLLAVARAQRVQAHLDPPLSRCRGGPGGRRPSLGPMRFDRRMSDAEGLLWRLEKDPFLSSNVANITIVDRPVDVARLIRRLERATQLVPRLRQRVQPAPVNVTPPSWVDDPGFDIGFHIRHIALPPPGDMRQLLDLAVLFAADPFERSRPLWEFLVVDGLDGGRAARDPDASTTPWSTARPASG